VWENVKSVAHDNDPSTSESQRNNGVHSQTLVNQYFFSQQIMHGWQQHHKEQLLRLKNLGERRFISIINRNFRLHKS
jgi:hypothetical protein